MIAVRQIGGQIANLFAIDEDRNRREVEAVAWLRRERRCEFRWQALNAFDVRKTRGDRDMRQRIHRHPWHCTGVAVDMAAIAARIATARRLTALTGAGVSAASGVPTFRGPGGLWRSFRSEALATPHAFRRDPYLVWEWYEWRRGLIATCQPNAAHDVISRWSARGGFTLVHKTSTDCTNAPAPAT
jgi:Sir2 family protein